MSSSISAADEGDDGILVLGTFLPRESIVCYFCIIIIIQDMNC